MKYLVYSTPKVIEKDIKKHELIAVEYGEDIYDVTDKLIRAVCDDIEGDDKYENHTASADAPELIAARGRKSNRYQYYMIGVASPNFYSETNEVLEYGVVEESE